MQVNRTEHKLIISCREQARLVCRLGQLMPLDPHCAGLRCYQVRSLYFDTVADRCCTEKEDGLLVHEKLRLRLYSPQDTLVKLESKRKVGAVQTKKTMLISRPKAQKLIDGDFSWLLAEQTPMALYFYRRFSQGYRPKAIIEYDRLSFCLNFNNTRITFDSSIRSTESCLDLFREELQMRPILSPGLTVMEIKFNNFLPDYLKQALRDLRQSPGSFSKYTAGRFFYRNTI